MKISLAEARIQAEESVRRQVFESEGIEYRERIPRPPKEDPELKEILERESQFQRDDKTPARIEAISKHLDSVDLQIDQLVYGTKIDKEILQELGLLVVLQHYHLERIEVGDKNPLAKELLEIFHSLR